MPFSRWIRAADEYQQRHARLAFAVGVAKKLGDDGAGQLAGMIAFYAFFSLVPLVLALSTVLAIVLHGDPDLQNRILRTSVGQLPGVGDYLRRSIVSVHGDVLRLLIGAVTSVLGGLGVTRASQTAFDVIWGVEGKRRYSFIRRQLRGLAVLALLGLANVTTTGVATAIDTGALNGVASAVLLVLAALIVNVGLFNAAFVLLTSRNSGWRDMLPGAVSAACGWLALQHVAGVLLVHLNHASDVSSASAVTRVLALLIGLLTWLYLGAQLALIGMEINSVRAGRLWPRSFR